MDYVTIKVNLPEDVAVRAEAAGLLTDEQVTALLVSELKRQERIDRLFNDLDRLTTVEPPLSPEEIAEEIRASTHRMLN
jgi:hypothetical protein